MKNKNDDIKFQFTRHSQSCNNISNVIHKVFEPSITYLGIEETIAFAKDQSQRNVFNHDKVCVSNLLRTWVTSVLLYGTQTSSPILTLYICPYLKEHITKVSLLPYQLKFGNWPVEFSVSLNRFLKFLNNGSKYDNKWFSSLPKTIIFVLPGLKGWNGNDRQFVLIEKSEIINADYQYVITRFCRECQNNKNNCLVKVKDTIGTKSTIPGYLKNGNLQEFMGWYNKTSLDIVDSNNTVHIVTHSNVMKEYLKQYFQQTVYSKSIRNIKSSNVCRFTTSVNNSQLPSVIYGIPMDKIKGLEYEERAIKENISLCDPNERFFDALPVCSKSNIDTSTLQTMIGISTGGTKTVKYKQRKKRKYKTKKVKKKKK